MRKGFMLGMASLVGGSLLLGTGCTTVRAVTDKYWYNSDTLYVSYVEGGHGGTKIRKCSRAADNTMACADEQAVNEVLEK